MTRQDAAKLIRQLRELRTAILRLGGRLQKSGKVYWEGQADGLEVACKTIRAQVQQDEKDDEAIVILGQGEYEKRLYH